jgi:hypothetical protein
VSDRRQLEEMTSWLVVVGRREGGRRKEGREGRRRGEKDAATDESGGERPGGAEAEPLESP